MKIYVSHSSKFDFENKLYHPLKNSYLMKENEFYFPHEIGKKVVNSKEIIKNSNLVLAEVSNQATGQGIELGWAEDAKVPILCIYEKGQTISSALEFITDTIIAYENEKDMIETINHFLKTIEKG